MKHLAQLHRGRAKPRKPRCILQVHNRVYLVSDRFVHTVRPSSCHFVYSETLMRFVVLAALGGVI